MHEDKLSYAPSFEEALEGLFIGEPVKKLSKVAEEEEQAEVETISTNRKLIRDADEYLNSYLRNMGDQNFDQAFQSLQQLEETLNQLKQQSQQDTIQ